MSTDFFLDSTVDVRFIGEFSGVNWWMLLRPIKYHVGSKNSDETISVDAGFVTDFASIPKIFYNILDPVGPYAAAAIVHDYLYRTHLYKKKKCDKIFLEAMLAHGVSKTVAYSMYYAVRFFGRSAYKAAPYENGIPKEVRDAKGRFAGRTSSSV